MAPWTKRVTRVGLLLGSFVYTSLLLKSALLLKDAQGKRPQKDVSFERWQFRQELYSRRTSLVCEQLKPLHPMRSGVEAIQDSSFASDRWSGPFLVDEKHKAIYCGLEKVASTSWKMIMMQLSRPSSSEHHWHDDDRREVHLKSVLREVGIRGLQEYSSAEIQHRLANYTKFLLVRHPVDRLLSAYRDKIESAGPGSYYYNMYGSHIINAHRQEAPSKDVIGVTFAELVRFITKEHQFDPHWEVYYDVCMPCYVNYTYVGHMENFTEDVSFILKSVFGTDFRNFPRINSLNKLQSNLLSRYLKTLTASELKNLNDVYDVDMQIFGYSHMKYNGNISMMTGS